MEAEQRFERLEAFREDTRERLARIEARLDVIESQLGHMATKADLAALETRLLTWFIATAFAMTTVMSAIAFAAVRLAH
ncbi:hypothetical protein FHW58_004363 [Duganella sp. 1224]|uniref:hypothetical protein n=1 Tax=Duganella sp. 1224 TaxID=2587052 RepID=UPI0015CD47F3|nr:hypothetical protein [Duganella sp. 1224]NYE63135.1 hypothetical protein [Duganella sp. 1224]